MVVLILLFSTMANECIECNLEVTPQQHAISCDNCERWQHRLCGTGITPAEYHRATQGEDLDWVCGPCLVAINEPQEDYQVYNDNNI